MRFKQWLQSGEDIFDLSKDAKKIRNVLKHWNKQHDYVGPSWDGIIKLHNAIAKIAKQAAFESAGWYKYKSSTKSDNMDGKDWRIILTEFDPVVVINCHSCINEDSWTLSTTVFNSIEINIDKLNVITHHKPKVRSLLWSIETAKILETHGYKYPEAIEAMTAKLKKAF